MKNILLLLFGITIIYLTGCDYFDNSDTLDSSSIEINISSLPALPDSLTYVAWVEHETDLDPTVIHASDADNGNFDYKSEQALRLIQLTQIFWLSIEHDSVLNDSVFTPGNDRILGGRFSQGGCNLGVGDLVYEFTSDEVIFNLLTPTDGSGTNETSGVWFVELDSAGQFQPITGLPELFPGWIYEGWVEVNGTYISTGRFNSPVGSDMINQYGSTMPAIPFPGEDFLENPPTGLTFPLNLAGLKVIISLEINDGRSSGESPYIIIYESSIPDPAESRVAYQMVSENASLPSGDVVIKVDLVK